jgi:hypothetical protein
LHCRVSLREAFSIHLFAIIMQATSALVHVRCLSLTNRELFNYATRVIDTFVIYCGSTKFSRAHYRLSFEIIQLLLPMLKVDSSYRHTLTMLEASLLFSLASLASTARALAPVVISHQGPVYWALPIHIAAERGYFEQLEMDPTFEVVSACLSSRWAHACNLS